MDNLRSRKIIVIIGYLVLSFLMFVFYGACKSEEKGELSEEKAELEIIPMSEFYSIFGKAGTESSGVYDVNQADEEISVSYRFFPVKMEEFEKEVGLELAPKIKEFYQKDKKADRVVFEIYIPDIGAPEGWRLYVSFVTTRKLIIETDWTNLLDADLFTIVEELKYSE